MKSLLIASSVGLAVLSGAARAAVLPLKAPYAPIASWTGCYVNGGGGYGIWNQDEYTESYPGLVANNATGTAGGRGWLGTVGAGCDYQMSRFVVGVLADYDFMDVHGGLEDSFSALAGTEKESGAWAVGGRIGYLVTPALLTYFNAGYTQARFDQVNLSSSGLGPTTDFLQAQTYHGWFVGGGTEYALNFGWLPVRGLFWRNEVRFSSYESADLPILATATGLPTATAYHLQPYVETVTSSLVWRFNFGGPISTRY